jgi:hypothetical protein
VTNGLLDFQATTAQTDTVQDVAKSSSYYHFNQYNDITTWSADGMTQLRKTYRQCAHYAGGPAKGPDIVIMDDSTFSNFEDSRLNLVRVSVVEDKTERSNTLDLSLGLASVKSSIDIDLADFTGVAADGVSYILNSDYLEFPLSEAPMISDFKERVGDQDVVTALFSMQGNLISTKVPAQGVVSGGSV